MSQQVDKKCSECGEKIIGRSDKRFCSDACRNTYNNVQNKEVTKLIRNTNNQLRRNYRILQKLNPTDKTKTTKSKLLLNGFDFNLVTSIYTTKTGNIYYFIYDQGYLVLENDYYALVKRN